MNSCFDLLRLSSTDFICLRPTSFVISTEGRNLARAATPLPRLNRPVVFGVSEIFPKAERPFGRPNRLTR